MTNRFREISHYLRLMRFDKPIGLFLLLWPALWALWVATRGHPPITVLFIFIMGVILMRSAGCIINDIVDRRFDAQVSRTKSRPLVTGDVSLRKAILLLGFLLMLAFGLVLFLNRLTIILALIAFLLAVIYPFLKRWTHLPQVGLGIAFSFSVPMIFAATTGHVPGIAWLLFVAAVCWPVAYDTQYAMADRADDVKIGVKSTAILFGRYDRLMIALLQAAMLLLLVVLAIAQHLRAGFYLSLLAAFILISHQMVLIRHREPEACLRAFRNNAWVGLVIFIGLLSSSF